MAWKRRAARIVLLDPDGRIFLIQAHDPAKPSDGGWWEIPGGGIDPGETSADAARRELYEETGIVAAEIGPCVWTQHVRFRFGGIDFDSHDEIHVAWASGGEYRPTHLETLEAGAFVGGRWWAVDDVMASTERFLPERLQEFLPAIAAGELPPSPVDITPDSGNGR